MTPSQLKSWRLDLAAAGSAEAIRRPEVGGAPGRAEGSSSQDTYDLQGQPPPYGAPRIHTELRDQGIRVARKTVAKLMKDHDIRLPRLGRRTPRTTESRHNLGIALNLLRRNFRAAEPDRI